MLQAYHALGHRCHKCHLPLSNKSGPISLEHPDYGVGACPLCLPAYEGCSNLLVLFEAHSSRIAPPSLGEHVGTSWLGLVSREGLGLSQPAGCCIPFLLSVRLVIMADVSLPI